ncbi:2-dehydropantoate 2-reductase [Noviherbaspirillum denitrificans]|uniref:2-dehydropantoate 2-reductase n=1 Tax=Noviherbaspirillum denitrificans TaxID=1968433 RepID=A0A254TFI1_9BURK|nr:2-dehydropantoate 2-reductase [Noviherbaspirillum denitrificans]OWW21370.1 2-dehydropantoate 2-reductase [Noviherbaspirillum denitrificans]
MKIAVFGFGAVGGLIGARLAEAGCEVSAVARGATLAALDAHGARLVVDGSTRTVAVRASADPAALGVQDLVIVAVKATALPDVARSIAPLIGPHTLVLTAMNGVPWWFFSGADVPYAGTRLPVLDPGGALEQAIPAQQVIGCVVHLSASCPEPGLVRVGFGNRLIVGEPAGGLSARVESLAALLAKAGFDAEASKDIRSDIWYKLWGNMTMNPVSALTGATCDRILDDPLVHRFCLSAMAEAAAIGAKIGCPIAQSGEDRMDVTRKLGAFKTSMLQDAEAGKALEIDALVTAVHEIGKLVGLATSNVDALLGLVRLFGKTRGLYN